MCLDAYWKGQYFHCPILEGYVNEWESKRGCMYAVAPASKEGCIGMYAYVCQDNCHLTWEEKLGSKRVITYNEDSESPDLYITNKYGRPSVHIGKIGKGCNWDVSRSLATGSIYYCELLMDSSGLTCTFLEVDIPSHIPGNIMSSINLTMGL